MAYMTAQQLRDLPSEERATVIADVRSKHADVMADVLSIAVQPRDSRRHRGRPLGAAVDLHADQPREDDITDSDGLPPAEVIAAQLERSR